MKFSQPIDCKGCQYFSPGDSENPDYCEADGTEFVEPYVVEIPDWCPLEKEVTPDGTPLMPCGHPQSEVISSDEGTSYCGACERKG